MMFQVVVYRDCEHCQDAVDNVDGMLLGNESLQAKLCYSCDDEFQVLDHLASI